MEFLLDIQDIAHANPCACQAHLQIVTWLYHSSVSCMIILCAVGSSLITQFGSLLLCTSFLCFVIVHCPITTFIPLNLFVFFFYSLGYDKEGDFFVLPSQLILVLSRSLKILIALIILSHKKSIFKCIKRCSREQFTLKTRDNNP